MCMTRFAAWLVVASSIALAQPGGGAPPSQLANAIDSDHDRTISGAEIKGAARALASLDKNHDGSLSEEELRPAFGGGPGAGGGAASELVKSLMAFDADSDGKLAKSEVPERMQGLFTRGDKNGDGVLSADELQALAGAQQQQARSQDGERRGPIDPMRGALDADRDGTISAAEIEAAPAALAKLDRNGDGLLTEEEYRPMRRGGGRGGNPEDMFNRLFAENDKNKDGKLAVSELPDRMREFMATADANKDGFISKEEMMSAQPGGGRREER